MAIYLVSFFKEKTPKTKEVQEKTRKYQDKWVKRLPGVIKAMNNEKTRMIGMAPVDAIKMKNVTQYGRKFKRPVGINEDRLVNGTKVRYLYFPGELEGGEKRRATDPIWSLDIFEINKSRINPGQPILYWLKKQFGERITPKRSFVREELQVI